MSAQKFASARHILRRRRTLLALAVCGLAGSAAAAAAAAAAEPDDADALSLTAAPAETPPPAGGSSNKLFVEGAIGFGTPRDGSGNHGLDRLSLDFIHAAGFAPGWRAVLSDRVDWVHPRSPLNTQSDGTVNSLREAYVSWQTGDGASAVDLGRMNLRYGPAYGYNPTDFFRDGSLRVVTTTNPLSLRENRLGTVVLRGQQLWKGGSLSAAFSPKLESRPSDSGASLDLGATNHRDRGLVVLGTQWSDRVSTQLLAYKESAARVALGASMTASVGDATVVFLEGSRAREPALLARTETAFGGPETPPQTRSRFTGGATWSPTGHFSITGEFEYNGFALDRDQWNALGGSQPAVLGAYLLEAQRSQELASRQAWLVYATQKDLFVKNLDLTVLLRMDAGDRSALAWIELRRHWDQIDLALQFQQQRGRVGTEYALYPDRRAVQLVASYFF